MGFLILAVLCSSSIALCFSWSTKYKTSWSWILAINYFIAFSTGLLFVILKPPVFTYLPIPLAFEEILTSLSKNVVLSAGSSLQFSILIGIIGGFLFFWSFYLYQKSITANGASLSGTFAKLGVLVPLILSLVIWRVLPTNLQWIGITCTLFSILLLYTKDTSKFHISYSLVFLLISMGLAEFNNKIFQQYANYSFKNFYLCILFFTALLFALFAEWKRKTPFRKQEVFFGIVIGITNFFSSFFLIKALTLLPATIVFPIFSSGSIVIITTCSIIFLKEKISSKIFLSILFSIIGVILMSIM